jgi:hypothetical protein
MQSYENRSQIRALAADALPQQAELVVARLGLRVALVGELAGARAARVSAVNRTAHRASLRGVRVVLLARGPGVAPGGCSGR